MISQETNSEELIAEPWEDRRDGGSSSSSSSSSSSNMILVHRMVGTVAAVRCTQRC